MTDRTIAPLETEHAAAMPRGIDRIVLSFALAGVALLIAAAGLLWWHEGLGVFLEVVIAGISACF